MCIIWLFVVVDLFHVLSKFDCQHHNLILFTFVIIHSWMRCVYIATQVISFLMLKHKLKLWTYFKFERIVIKLQQMLVMRPCHQLMIMEFYQKLLVVQVMKLKDYKQNSKGKKIRVTNRHLEHKLLLQMKKLLPCTFKAKNKWWWVHVRLHYQGGEMVSSMVARNYVLQLVNGLSMYDVEF
jgi:HrpA-like RNA helicase